MKCFFVIVCFFILCSFSVLSQNVKNKYTSHRTENGSVFFIYPQKGFESKNISEKLEYDITYLSSSDSVTYNFTFVNTVASPVDSVSFKVNERTLTAAAEMLFVSPQKNKWKHRVSVRIPQGDIKELYNQAVPYNLLLHSAKGDIQFDISQKKWDEHKSIVNKIFEIIKYNQY